MQPEKQTQFRSDINGLRAVAVLAVLLFHFSVAPFHGGFVGVDVFFVISGYLMTEIALRGLTRGNFSVVDFYLRRMLRIIPALALLIVVLLAVGAALLLPEAFKRLATDAAYALSFLINFRFVQDTGYFGDNPTTSWLLHCWSLAVEFQFYLFFPLAAWGAWRLGRRRGLAVLLVATVLIALPYSYLETARHQMSAFYLLPARTWEFALGGLAALVPAPRFARGALAWLGLGLICVATLWFDSTWLYPSAWSLLPVAGTALVIWANTANPVLESSPFQFLGKISYSLYLWHWPVICIARYAGIIETPLVTLGMLALAIALGWLSFAYFENRFRGLQRDTRLRSFVLLAGASTLIGGVGMLMTTATLTKWRIPTAMDTLVNNSIHTNQFRDNVCFMSPDQHFSDLAPECTTAQDPQKSSLLIWGDSHAAQLYPGIMQQPWSKQFNVLQITASACPPIQLDVVPGRPFCPEIERLGLERIKQIKPHAVLMAGGVLGLAGSPNDARRDADKAPQLKALIEELRAAGVAEVYVMGRLPKWRIGLPQLVYIRNRTHVDHLHDRARIFNEDSMPSEDRVLRAVTEAAGGKYVSIGEVNCEGARCLTLVPTLEGRALTQFDSEHLTTQGAGWVASRAIGPAMGFAPGQRMEVALDEMVTFQEGAKGTQLLTKGWMPPEGWGTWTIHQDEPGVMVVPVPFGARPSAVKITFWGQLAPVFPEERFSMSINSRIHQQMVVTLDQPIRTETYVLTPEVQEEVANAGVLRLEFMAPEGRSSKAMGLNQDERVLGFGIRELTLLK